MTKIKKETIQQVASMQQDMSALTQEKIKEMAPKPLETELKMSLKERAKLEGAYYLEPKISLPANSKPKPEYEAKRKRDWEYVKGVYRHEDDSLEPMGFWFLKWPGDPYCMWEVPVGVPVYVPRMIAHHLSGEKDPDTGIEAMKYHKFGYGNDPISMGDASANPNKQFRPVGTFYRGKFTPVGAFS